MSFDSTPPDLPFSDEPAPEAEAEAPRHRSGSNAPTVLFLAFALLLGLLATAGPVSAVGGAIGGVMFGPGSGGCGGG